MESDDYSYWARKALRLSEQEYALFWISFLPLLDGFFIAFLTTDMIQEPIAFGLTAFSGAGSVVAAMGLRGSPSTRIGLTIKVYLLILLGAVAIALATPTLRQLVPSNMSELTAIFLILLGFSWSTVGALQKVANKIGFGAIPKIMLAILVANTLLGLGLVLLGLRSDVHLRFGLDWQTLHSIGVSVSAAFILTLLLGTLMGCLQHEDADKKPLKVGAAVSLILMGVKLLGLPIQSWQILTPVMLGATWVTMKSLAAHFSAVRRLKSRPDNSRTD